MPPARSQPLSSSLHAARCRTVRWVVAVGLAAAAVTLLEATQVRNGDAPAERLHLARQIAFYRTNDLPSQARDETVDPILQ